ncbi:MAG: SH3 domain-containing protein [Proteobacteria bacterium]|nr:SH3 domain-containing protein [Pseudomonadota bacterium]
MAQENLQSLYKQALDSLAKGKYPEAQKDLENLYSNGWRSPGLDYYLGRAMISNKNFGSGIWHLYEAQKSDRFNGDIRKDIEIAQNLIPGGRGMPMEHPSEWAFTLQSYVRAEEQFFIAGLLGFILLSAKFIKALSKRQSIFGLCLMIMLIVSALFTSLGKSFAIVQKDSTLRAAPLDAAEETAQATSGSRVRILRKNDDYSEVERVGSFRGWIHNNSLLFYR